MVGDEALAAWADNKEQIRRNSLTAALESRDLEPLTAFALRLLLSFWRKEFDGGNRKAA